MSVITICLLLFLSVCSQGLMPSIVQAETALSTSTRQLRASSRACTAPRTVQDAHKPYCFVPDTVSPAAQQLLAVGHPTILQAHLRDNATAVQQLRQFAASANEVLSNRAKQQYLTSTVNDTVAGIPVVYGTPKGYNAATSNNKLIIYL